MPRQITEQQAVKKAITLVTTRYGWTPSGASDVFVDDVEYEVSFLAPGNDNSFEVYVPLNGDPPHDDSDVVADEVPDKDELASGTLSERSEAQVPPVHLGGGTFLMPDGQINAI